LFRFAQNSSELSILLTASAGLWVAKMCGLVETFRQLVVVVTLSSSSLLACCDRYGSTNVKAIQEKYLPLRTSAEVKANFLVNIELRILLLACEQGLKTLFF